LMNAGRELDALVAEKVMGWKVRPDRYPVDATGQSQFRVPEYSTDIAAAWRVVEQMRQVGWFVQIHDHTTSWEVALGRPEWVTSDLYQARVMPSASSVTAPHAICLAALAALA
jgi:hypothetical protein